MDSIFSLLFFLKLESIPQILRYCIYETMNLALNEISFTRTNQI